ncbi:MAG: prepilin peptidase [Holosporaceae bacterium]|jgi:Flp pilus assembly protein protease CpaA|nr:prepilin peptidase [Holosporaceae bacterium]
MFGILLLIISIGDFLFFRIENEYVLALTILYVISCASGVSGNNFCNGFAAAIATFAVTFGLNHFNLIGGGDVKLLFPMVLFAESNLLTFLIGVSIGGVILAIVYFLFSRQIFFMRRKIICSLYIFSRKQNKSCLLNFALLSLSRIDKRIVALRKYTFNAMKQEIPYGMAISFGGFCVIYENCVARW